MLNLKHKVKKETNNKHINPNHHKDLKMIKKAKHHNQVKNQEQHLIQAQWLLNRFIMYKENKMTNGQLWLSSIHSYLKKKKNFREFDNNNLKRKLRLN